MKKEKKVLPLFGLPALAPFIRPYRKTLIIMIALAFLSSLIDALYPLFNRYALDHFVAEGTLQGMPFFIALYLLTVTVQCTGSFRSLIYAGKVEMSINRDLRNAAFDHIQTLSFSYFNQHSVGYVHARIMSDTGKIGEAVSWRMMDCMWEGAYLFFALVVMIAVDLHLALLIIALLLVAALICWAFQSKLVVQNRKIREMNSTITGNFNEGIVGARTIRLLGIEKKLRKEFEEDTESMRRESVRAVRYSALLIASVTFMSSAALALVLWQGGILTRAGFMKIGTLSVFLSYAVGMIEPLQIIIQNISAFIAIQVNIERFTKLLEEPADVSDSPEVVEKYGDSYHPKKENWEEFKGDIEFRDVSFRYPDGEEYVMEHFSLKVPHGMNIAIVGETGAGKSTLVNLVCRFYEPTKGHLLIDGRDARERSQLWLHSNLGYVLQTPHLFSGTVRENLRYGKPDATEEEILRAIHLVAADEVVARMGRASAGASGENPLSGQDAEEEQQYYLRRGLDAEVGESGSQLSTGEKQLLSFARALLADPRLLILDEATSSIDTLTERAIQNAVSVVIRGRTSFVIAHRLSTITQADLILVVKDGRIIERGTHRELLKERGYYCSLYRRQYGDAF